MASMDEFKGKPINFVIHWLQENGFERLKIIFEGKNINFIRKGISLLGGGGVINI